MNTRLCLLSLASFFLVSAGCHSLKLTPPAAGEKGAARPEKDVALATPGKYSVRASQYVFLSDFEIKRGIRYAITLKHWLTLIPLVLTPMSTLTMLGVWKATSISLKRWCRSLSSTQRSSCDFM